MNKKSELLKTFELASKETHSRTFHFELGGKGTDIVCPRLSLRNQAAFERHMMAKPERKGSGFSLSALRNTTAMRMAECSADVLGQLREENAPDKFRDENEARMWSTEFQARVVSKFAPYANDLFGQFGKDDQVHAAMLSLQQEYGDGETTSTGKGENRKEEDVEFDEDFVRMIFDAVPDKLDAVFLWVIGLVDIPDGTETDDVAKSLEDLAAQAGGSGNVAGAKPKKKSSGVRKLTTKPISQ